MNAKQLIEQRLEDAADDEYRLIHDLIGNLGRAANAARLLLKAAPVRRDYYSRAVSSIEDALKSAWAAQKYVGTLPK